MDDLSPVAAPQVLLTYAVDAIDECLQLISVGRRADQPRRRWWQSGFLRTSADVVEDQRLLYVDENARRASEHWRESVDLVSKLAAAGEGNPLITELVAELSAAGADRMAQRLQGSQLPGPVDELVAHLNGAATDLLRYRSMMTRTRHQLRLGAANERDD